MSDVQTVVPPGGQDERGENASRSKMKRRRKN